MHRSLRTSACDHVDTPARGCRAHPIRGTCREPLAVSGGCGQAICEAQSEAQSEARSAPARPADVRMVPLAAASWGSAWLGTSEVPAGIAAAATCVAVGLAVAALRRSALALTVALATAVVLCAAIVDMHRLRQGPVASLATHQAVVSAEVEIRADPHRVAETGMTSGAAVVRAAIVRIEGRGGSWLVRAPVLVIVSGARVEEWLRMPVGTRVVVDGRMESPDRGSDVAAVLRVRVSGVIVAPPSAGLRLVERVRAGLRQAVVNRREEPRALVPALVLGDTSGLDPELTRDFQTTGLTHLTAVSGANLTLLLGFLLTTARWIRVRGWWLRVVGLAGVIIFVAAVSHRAERAARSGDGSGCPGRTRIRQPRCRSAQPRGSQHDLALGGSISQPVDRLRAVRPSLCRHRLVGPTLDRDHQSLAATHRCRVDCSAARGATGHHPVGGGDFRTGEPVGPSSERIGRSIGRSCDCAGLCGSRSVTDQRGGGRHVRFRGCLVRAGDHLDRQPGFATSWALRCTCRRGR